MPNLPLAHRNSGDVLKSNGTAINVGDFIDEHWGPGTKIGMVSLSTTPVELKVGSTRLHERHALYLTNDSSRLLYVGNSSNMSSTSGILIASGSYIVIQLFLGEEIPIWGMTYAGATQVRLMEMKST